MMMRLTAAISYVLLSTSRSAANVNCNSKMTEFSGPWGFKRSTVVDRGTQARASGASDGNYRKKTTKFAGWWRDLKRHPMCTTKRATEDSGRPTGSGENKV